MEVYLIASYIPVYQRDPYGISCKDNILRSYALHSRVHTEEVFSTGENVVMAAVNKKQKAGFGILKIGRKYRYHLDWDKGRILGIKEDRVYENLNNCVESDNYWIYCETGKPLKLLHKDTFKFVHVSSKSTILKERTTGDDKESNHQSGILVFRNTVYMVNNKNQLVSVQLNKPFTVNVFITNPDDMTVADLCIYKDQVLVAGRYGRFFSLGFPKMDFKLDLGPCCITVAHIGALVDRIVIVSGYGSIILCKDGGQIMDIIYELSNAQDRIRNIKITSRKNMGIMWLNQCHYQMEIVLFNRNKLMLVKDNKRNTSRLLPANYALATVTQTKALVCNSFREVNLFSLHLSLK